MNASRRSFLALAAAAPLLASAGIARAEARTSRVRSWSRDALGVTLVLELDQAPFPAPGSPYRDNTVIVFAPDHLRSEPDGRVGVLVHFHGHRGTAERAMVNHQLREQLRDSRQDAVLVVPQGPLEASDSSAGKLEASRGLARMLDDVFATLATPAARAALGRLALPAGAGVGRVCLSAHSGGYHAAACAVKHGGVPVNEVYLFDALYADADVFRDWVAAGRGKTMRERHKLVCFAVGGTTTAAQSDWLRAQLEGAGVRCVAEEVEGTLSREELTRADAVFIRTALAHGAVSFELNALRDCLYASGLKRHVRSGWFAHKDGARPLERRR